MTRITRSENNDHLLEFRKDYPHITAAEMGTRFGCSENSIQKWSSLKYQRKPAPLWTISAVQMWRKELEANGVMPYKPNDAAPVRQGDSSIFLVTVPSGKVASLKNIIGVFGGEITEV